MFNNTFFNNIISGVSIFIVCIVFLLLKSVINNKNIFQEQKEAKLALLRELYNSEADKLYTCAKERNELQQQYNFLKNKISSSMEKLKNLHLIVLDNCRAHMKTESIKIQKEFKKDFINVFYENILKQMENELKYKSFKFFTCKYL